MQIPSFENNIFGLIPKEEWLDVGFNVSRPNDPVDALFPDEYSENLVAKWQEIANQYQLPVMADFHSFDSRTNIATRIPVDTHSIISIHAPRTGSDDYSTSHKSGHPFTAGV